MTHGALCPHHGTEHLPVMQSGTIAAVCRCVDACGEGLGGCGRLTVQPPQRNKGRAGCTDVGESDHRVGPAVGAVHQAGAWVPDLQAGSPERLASGDLPSCGAAHGRGIHNIRRGTSLSICRRLGVVHAKCRPKEPGGPPCGVGETHLLAIDEGPVDVSSITTASTCLTRCHWPSRTCTWKTTGNSHWQSNSSITEPTTSMVATRPPCAPTPPPSTTTSASPGTTRSLSTRDASPIVLPSHAVIAHMF